MFTHCMGNEYMGQFSHSTTTTPHALQTGDRVQNGFHNACQYLNRNIRLFKYNLHICIHICFSQIM